MEGLELHLVTACSLRLTVSIKKRRQRRKCFFQSSLGHIIDNFQCSEIDEFTNFVTDAKQRPLLVILCSRAGRIEKERFINDILLFLPENDIVAAVKQSKTDCQPYFYFESFIIVVIKRPRKID